MTRESLMAAVRIGAIAGGTMIFVVTIGFVETVARREVLADVLSLSTVMLAIVGILTGVIAARPSARDPDPPVTTALARGAVAGVVSGAMLGAFALFADAVNVRDIFSNLSPSAIETITFDMEPAIGAVILIVGGAVLGAFGAILRILPPLPTRMVVTAGAAIVVLEHHGAGVPRHARRARPPRGCQLLLPQRRAEHPGRGRHRRGRRRARLAPARATVAGARGIPARHPTRRSAIQPHPVRRRRRPAPGPSTRRRTVPERRHRQRRPLHPARARAEHRRRLRRPARPRLRGVLTPSAPTRSRC